ncbi:hypothetical protein GCM10007053_01330 [Halioglobus pacificus]|uniref:Uncharacterized protein n=1 Tax=Parahalioglobus pacificus TaxID=930806 RepID=A0A918XCA2_9GAMM|nr:hypothetical protein GCM10007053_01330 [Halioglobus pacificus]
MSLRHAEFIIVPVRAGDKCARIQLGMFATVTSMYDVTKNEGTFALIFLREAICRTARLLKFYGIQRPVSPPDERAKAL